MPIASLGELDGLRRAPGEYEEPCDLADDEQLLARRRRSSSTSAAARSKYGEGALPVAALPDELAARDRRLGGRRGSESRSAAGARSSAAPLLAPSRSTDARPIRASSRYGSSAARPGRASGGARRSASGCRSAPSAPARGRPRPGARLRARVGRSARRPARPPARIDAFDAGDGRASRRGPPRGPTGSESIQSADTPVDARARAARGIWPYAPSRTSAWTNTYCFAPATAERCSRRTNSFRSSACSRSPRTQASVPNASAESASVQNTLPSTAACWSSSFSSAGRASIRATTTPWSVSGHARRASARHRACAHTPRRRADSRRPVATARLAPPPAGPVGPRRTAIRRAVSSSASAASEVVRRVPFPAAPARAALEQLGPRAADDEQRDARDALDQPVDEVEQPVVGPVQVFENEHERAASLRGLRRSASTLRRLRPGEPRRRRLRRRGRRAGADDARPRRPRTRRDEHR